MISTKDLISYEFETIEKYYDYILDSIVNGQRMQACDLVANLSKAQKKLALNYFDDPYYLNVDEYKAVKQMVIDSL